MKFRLQNIVALVLAFPFLFFSRSRKRNNNNPKKVIILQLAKMGDMVCTTPMFRAVKEKYPSCHLLVVGNKVNQEILAHNTDVDDYFIFDRNNLTPLIKKLKQESFDFGCMTGTSTIGLSLLIRSGVRVIAAPKVIGKDAQTRTYKFLSGFVHQKNHTIGQYAPREYLRLLEPINIQTNKTKKYLQYSKSVGEKADILVKGFDLKIGICPFVGHKIKQWPLDRSAGLIDYLFEKYKIQPFIFGGPNDLKGSAQMTQLLDSKTKVNNFVGKISIDELKAIISKLDLFISVDTGVIYIAEAFGVATIDIVGPMDEKEQPPISKSNIVLVPPQRRAPELHIMNTRSYDPKEATRQAKAITLDMVIKACEELIPKLKF